MMVGRHGSRRAGRTVHLSRSFVECLESRTLLSAGHGTIHPGVIVSKADSSDANVIGDTPAQIEKAYGIDKVNLGFGVSPNGSGQTIAIVDPYNDPNVSSDLTVFDNEFGIGGSATLTVVNQTGGTHLPPTNGSWAGEIATDVEWAHAIAPGANILLVETNSDSTDDLMAGVSYAIKQPSVSVISLSWGGDEFASQTTFDSDFNTPAGHIPVTVLAAAGDNGASSGAQWPASAPNVVSVGGSVLHLADDTGTYGSETSWTDSSGGISKFEKEPFFQVGVDSSGFRSMPDVAMNADDNIGMALYDSVPYQGISGWQTTNGTSVGTPEWAALVTIANQGRVQNSQATLDGPTQTLPLLYSLYGAPGTSAYSTYTTYFNDITVPQNATQTSGIPTVGYDTTSGLGSPKAATIVGALINAPSAAELANVFQTGSSPVQVTMLKQPPTSVVSGSAGTLRVKLTNSSGNIFAGPLVVTLDASTDISLTTTPTQISTMTIQNLDLRVRGSKVLNLKFTYPSLDSQTDEYLVASVNPLDGTTPASVAASIATVTIAPPFVKLTPVLTGSDLIRVNPGKSQSATILVRDEGNIIAGGTLSLVLYDSTDNTLDTSDTMLATTKAKKINLRPGKTTTLRVPFRAPAGLAAGYFLIATITSSATTQTGTAVIGTK